MANELMKIEELNPVDVYKGGLDDIIDKIEEEARSIHLDISTEAGRKEIASVAYKIARSKTLIDNTGKKLGEDARLKIKAINADRNKACDRLNDLKDEIRKPLTDFENAEKTRIADHEAGVNGLSTSYMFELPPSIQQIKIKLSKVENWDVSGFQEFCGRAEIAKSESVKKLRVMLEEAEKREAEQAELERLRADALERERLEREEKLKQEAAEIARKEAEERAAEAAQKEASRVAEEKSKDQRDKDEAEARAKKAEEDRIAADIKSKNDAKEAAEQAEADKQAAIESERKRVANELAAKKAEDEKRENDKKHRAKIHNEIKEALGLLLDSGKNGDDPIKDIIIAIAKGNIPNVKITY